MAVVNPPTDSPLYLIQLPKGNVMDHNDPSNSAVKPGLSTSEGKIAVLVALVTALTPLIAALAHALPENQWAQVALAALAFATALFVALGWMKKRSDVKETANLVAGGLAMADKAAAIAKDHPALAALLLKSAGIGGNLVPPQPAAGP